MFFFKTRIPSTNEAALYTHTQTHNNTLQTEMTRSHTTQSSWIIVSCRHRRAFNTQAAIKIAVLCCAHSLFPFRFPTTMSRLEQRQSRAFHIQRWELNKHNRQPVCKQYARGALHCTSIARCTNVKSNTHTQTKRVHIALSRTEPAHSFDLMMMTTMMLIAHGAHVWSVQLSNNAAHMSVCCVYILSDRPITY